jgi:predicted DNA binding CopG/RHH family protein
MTKKLKKIPKFKNENDEFEFWSCHDSTEYVDWGKAKKIMLPNLKRTTKLVSVNMPVSLLEQLKILANKKDMAYQSLMKLFLLERVKKEFSGKSNRLVH